LWRSSRGILKGQRCSLLSTEVCNDDQDPAIPSSLTILIFGCEHTYRNNLTAKENMRTSVNAMLRNKLLGRKEGQRNVVHQQGGTGILAGISSCFRTTWTLRYIYCISLAQWYYQGASDVASVIHRGLCRLVSEVKYNLTSLVLRQVWKDSDPLSAINFENFRSDSNHRR